MVIYCSTVHVIPVLDAMLLSAFCQVRVYLTLAYCFQPSVGCGIELIYAWSVLSSSAGRARGFRIVDKMVATRIIQILLVDISHAQKFCMGILHSGCGFCWLEGHGVLAPRVHGTSSAALFED